MDKVLESRLVTKDTVISGPCLSRCALKFQAFSKSKISSEPANSALDNFIRDVKLYKQDILNTKQIFLTCEKQIQAYHRSENEIRSEIVSTQTNISKFQQDLEHQKAIRKSREDLEIRATEVNTFDSRSMLKRKIDDVEEKLAAVHTSSSVDDGRIAQRRKQISDLMQAITALQQPLVEEESSAPSETMNEGDDEGDEDDESSRPRNRREDELADDSSQRLGAECLADENVDEPGEESGDINVDDGSREQEIFDGQGASVEAVCETEGNVEMDGDGEGDQG